MNKKAFGKFVKKHREEKNLTQNDLAEALHVSPKTVSAWERGQSYPDLEGLEELCTVLDVTVQQVYDESQGSASGINVNTIAIAIIGAVLLLVGGGFGIKNLIRGVAGGPPAPIETSPQPTNETPSPTNGETPGETLQPTIGMPLEPGCYQFVGGESVDLPQDSHYYEMKIFLDSNETYMITLMDAMSYAPSGSYKFYQDGDKFYLHLVETGLYFEVTYHNLHFLPEMSSDFLFGIDDELWTIGPDFEFVLPDEASKAN